MSHTSLHGPGCEYCFICGGKTEKIIGPNETVENTSLDCKTNIISTYQICNTSFIYCSNCHIIMKVEYNPSYCIKCACHVGYSICILTDDMIHNRYKHTIAPKYWPEMKLRIAEVRHRFNWLDITNPITDVPYEKWEYYNTHINRTLNFETVVYIKTEFIEFKKQPNSYFHEIKTYYDEDSDSYYDELYYHNGPICGCDSCDGGHKCIIVSNKELDIEDKLLKDEQEAYKVRQEVLLLSIVIELLSHEQGILKIIQDYFFKDVSAISELYFNKTIYGHDLVSYTKLYHSDIIENPTTANIDEIDIIYKYFILGPDYPEVDIKDESPFDSWGINIEDNTLKLNNPILSIGNMYYDRFILLMKIVNSFYSNANIKVIYSNIRNKLRKKLPSIAELKTLYDEFDTCIIEELQPLYDDHNIYLNRK